VIDKYQTAILSGRGLLDSVLVVKETVDFLKKEKQKGVIVKVDYVKAYDSVDWDFWFTCWVGWVFKINGSNG